MTYNYNGATGGNNQASATATATFNGWAKTAGGTKVYDDKENVNNLTTTNGGTVDLFAKWTDASVTLPTPTKTGYTFGGWYADSGLNTPAGAAGATYTPSTQITLYAKWTPISYPITYHLNGGTLNTAHESYTIESATITLDEPTRKGYNFAGWYTNQGLTGPAVTTIDHGSTGNVELWAKWTIATYTITYNLVYGNVTTANKTTYTVEDDDFTLNNPTKDHFTFTGWTGSNGTTPQTAVTITKGSFAEDLCYTANYAVGAHDGTCGADGADVYYAYDSSTNTFEIFGTGDMKDYDRDTDRPWYSCYKDIKTVVIGNGVKSIGSYAFYDCNSLTSITIPASVTNIGDVAFNKCSSLASITIPASVTYIGSEAFKNCTDLTSVTIYAPSLASWSSNVFVNNASGRKIYVFSDCVDTYKAQAELMGVDEDDILPIESISLKDAADNSSLITAADGASLAVTLQGRTLYKDGAWNTLYLPFDVTISGSVLDGEGVDVRTLSTTSFDAAKGELTLNFTPAPGQTGAVTTLQAGKPYIIKWTKPSGYVAYNGENAATCSDIVNPVFTGVTVSSTAVNVSTGYVDFIGTFSPEVIYEDGTEKHNLYLGADNKLYYPTAENFKVNACRGYFQLKGLTAGEPDTSNGVRAFVLNFGDEETTGIVDIEHGTLNIEHSADAGWYDLSGRKLYGKPTKKGLYIHQGKKIAIK